MLERFGVAPTSRIFTAARVWSSVSTVALLLAAMPALADFETPRLAFNADIRPILSHHCYRCHGPDENTREAGMRLDVPSDLNWEDVLDRITHDDPDLVMPPPSTNKPLNDGKVNALQHWIEQGSAYESHWAFVPPERATVPREPKDWPHRLQSRHPIDRFIDRRLQAAGMQRSDRAGAANRVRRVYLDLIGLPPPIEVVDAFEKEPSREAYETLVDDLLASPRYGERWARRWLDLARYADTNGYEKDRDRPMWPYRDWVIRAINGDLPFDEFTVQQIAGDMLPHATVDQRVATGFHRNTMLNEEGGIDPLEYRFHAMTDRVATTGTTWLGLTTGCAQCHTHKYDPITHEDYYGMMAYLDNADEPKFYIPDPAAMAKYHAAQDAADAILLELPRRTPKPANPATPRNENQEAATRVPRVPDATIDSFLPAEEFDWQFRSWLNGQLETVVPWSVWVPQEASSNLPHLTILNDALGLEPSDRGVVFASGDSSKHDTFHLQLPARSEVTTAIRLEALPDDRLPARGPGMTDYEGPDGDFFLSELVLRNALGETMEIQSASETYAKNAYGKNPVSAALATDGDLQTGWSANGRAGFASTAVFVLRDPIPAGRSVSIEMHFGRHFSSSLGKFRLSGTSSPKPVVATSLVRKELLVPDPAKDLRLRESFLLDHPRWTALANEYVRLRQTPPGQPALVMRERGPENPRSTYLRHRGEYTQPSTLVKPRLPEALVGSGTDVPNDRLSFARWLVGQDNPLTSRVVVNRHWEAFFGNGLVRTVDDFGMQGEIPSHPDLLDYLAVSLRENGWSIKWLHRMIVTSETYQQESIHDPETGDTLRLLARFPRQRLEAEVIRDAALFAAGILSDKMFGPPVRPPQPEAAQSANYKKSKWVASQGSDRFRRSVYTYVKRTAPFEMYLTFDGISGEACVARRDRSNTPLQALTLLNDPMFMEIAERYGARMQSLVGSPRERIATGFRWLLARRPSDFELEELEAFYEKHSQYSAVARVLLCLDEAITRN
ncbi:MAG: PSD1 and planctomycete cytochrome C domain-containing protein [Planctomycetota bacterium]